MEVAKQGYGLDRFNRYMVECECVQVLQIRMAI